MEEETTVVDHSIRKKLKISITDYCVLDIYLKTKGNISQKKNKAAKTLGINPKTVTRSISRLASVKLLEKPKPVSGYVYILRSKCGRYNPGCWYYKIGKTINIKKRLSFFTASLPFPIELLHTIETDNCSKLEAEYHKRYKDKRLNGEWFRLTADDERLLTAINKVFYNE